MVRFNNKNLIKPDIKNTRRTFSMLFCFLVPSLF